MLGVEESWQNERRDRFRLSRRTTKGTTAGGSTRKLIRSVGVFGREEITKVADRLVGDLAEQRSVFQPAPIRALPDTGPPADHAKAFRLFKNLRRLRSAVHFLCNSQNARKTCDQADGVCARRGAATGRSGVRELNIVAQDTTYYGMDLYGEPRLTELLRELDQIEGLDWIRLMYFYPMYIDDRLLKRSPARTRSFPTLICHCSMPMTRCSDGCLVVSIDVTRSHDPSNAGVDSRI